MAHGTSKETPKTPITLARIMAALEENAADYPGFCLACGAEVQGIDPDARGDECEICGARRVYGAEECLLKAVA